MLCVFFVLCVLTSFYFICCHVCAQSSTIATLIVLLIDEMDSYLNGFNRKRDGINYILYAVAIGSIIWEIDYYDNQLLIT